MLSYILYIYLILYIRNSRHQLQTMSDNSSVVLLFPPGMSLLQFGSKVYPRKFLFQGFWQFRWVLLYGAGPAFLLHFRKMQMRKAKGGVAWYAVEQWKPICSFASCFCTEICIEWNRDFHLQNWIPTVIQNIPSETVQQMKKYFEKACFPLVTSANSYVAPVKSQILGSRHISSFRYIHVSWILYNIFIYDYLCHHDYHRHQLVQVLGSW